MALLNRLIINKSEKDKVKYLKSYRNVFQGRNREKFIDRLNNSKRKPELEELLELTDKKKKVKAIKRIVKYINTFDEEVQNELLFRLANSQNSKNSMQIVDDAIEISFPDYTYLKNEIKYNSELTFKNKQFSLKIKVKSMKKG